MSDVDDLRIRRAAMETRWGMPVESRTFDNPGISIDVLKWPKGKNSTGVTLYATVGTPLPAGSDQHVDEFVLGIDPDIPNATWVVAALASMRAEGRGRVSHNSTVGFGEPLWPDTQMTGVLILSYDDDDRNIPLTDGRHLDLLTVLPVFDEEIEFVRTSGSDALMAKWSDQDVAYWDPHRKNSCPRQ